ncbi:MAG TPA: hypothetical protein VFA53_12230 [Xanthobacteraceae bacterium]|nr:hypothetical protein [Xanthobacteraceae bacterium]
MPTKNEEPLAADACIPQIACPRCGQYMRLATIEPEGRDRHACLNFECGCGFEFRMPESAPRRG